MLERVKYRICAYFTLKKLVAVIVFIFAGVLLSGINSSTFWRHSTTVRPLTGIEKSTINDDTWKPSVTVASELATSKVSHDGFSVTQATGGKDHILQRFPQSIIIGVKKGGTRALIDMLKTHPQIVSANGEVHFFDRDQNFKKGKGWYVAQMPFTTDNQITIEKSPSYFIHPDAPQRMLSFLPSLKLILIVRNPVDRAISDFSQLFTPERNQKNMSFESLVLQGGRVVDSLSLIRVSCYDVHIQQWLKLFSLKQIHIVDGDALITNPAPELIKVETFLGVSSFFKKDMFYFNETKGFYCWKKSKRSKEISYCLGSGKGRPHPHISDNVIKILKEFFRPHNKAFFDLTGKEFSWDDS